MNVHAASIEKAGSRFIDEVYDRISGSPDGLTLQELLGHYPSPRGNLVYPMLAKLKRQRKIVEVTRTHGTDEAGRDHARLMVLRSRSDG